MILLDSDVLIEILEKNSKKGQHILNELRKFNEEFGTTALNLEEILFGVFKRTNTKTLPSSHPLNLFPTFPFTDEDAKISAKLEVEMELAGKKKPRGDMLIAAIAIRMNAKFLSLNLKHFQDVPGINLITIKFSSP